MRGRYIILLLTISISGCQIDRASDEAQRLYLRIKGKDLSEFKRWNVYLREGKDNVFLFDYIPFENLESRYLIVDNDSIIYKEIFPVGDSLFHHLDKDLLVTSCEREKLIKKLFFDFQSLDIDGISYNKKDSIFLFKRGQIMLLNTVAKNIDITRTERYEMYHEIDSNWYYYEY